MSGDPNLEDIFTCTLLRPEADGKLYVRYQVIGPNHVAVPTHFFKVSLPFWAMRLFAEMLTQFAASGADFGEG